MPLGGAQRLLGEDLLAMPVESPPRRPLQHPLLLCACLHLLVLGSLLHYGPPARALADFGTYLALGCALLAFFSCYFSYPALPLLLAASFGLALQRAPQPHTAALVAPRPVRLLGRLREWHPQNEHSWALFDQLQTINGKPLAPGSSSLLGLAHASTRPPSCGDLLVLEGKLRHDGRFFRLENFRWRLREHRRPPPLLALRNHLRQRLQQSLNPQQAGLAAALLLGERREVSPWLQETYRRFGLVHLLAVSGMHFWLWDQLLRRLLRGPSAMLRLPILALAACLAGASPPVMRAFCVVLLRDLGALQGRRIPGLSLWSCAWLMEVSLLPPTALGLGYVLSYAATFFLIVGAAPAQASNLRKTLQASTVAFLGSMPFLHMVQGTLEPWSIPLSPILGLLLPLRLTASALALLPALGPWMNPVLSAASWLEERCFQILEHVPWSPYSCPQNSSLCYLAAAVLALCLIRQSSLPKVWRRGGWVAFAILLWAPTPLHPGILALPVDHGLGVLVVGNTQSLLFDFGSNRISSKDLVDQVLYPQLLHQHWPVPHWAIQSHQDHDHVQGFPALEKRTSLQYLRTPRGSRQSLSLLPPWKLELYGCQGAKQGVSNDGGHALDLRLGSFRAVLLGDQAGASLEDLARRLPPGPIQVLLLPHHGLTTIGLSTLLQHLQPKRAWISCGPGDVPLPAVPLLDYFGIPWQSTMDGALLWQPK